MKAQRILTVVVWAMTSAGPVAAQSDDSTKHDHAQTFKAHGWQVMCRPGEDGFAVNCYAEKMAGSYTLRLNASDSQIFVLIEHPQCQVSYKTFWREDLIGLTTKARYARVSKAMRAIARDMTQTCKTLPPVKLDLSDLPDVAMAVPDKEQ